MHRRLVAILAIAALGLASAGCSSDDDAKDGDAVTDATTTTVAETTTTAAVPAGPVTTAEAAADGLFEAWQDGDRNDASRYARQRAIEALFSHPNTGDVDYQEQGCEPQGGQFICSWTYPGGALQMTVEGVAGSDGFVVDNVTYTAD